MMRDFLIAGSATLAILQSAAVGAQATNPTSNPTTVSDESQGLQEVVVTAQRREENLQRAALAVSAVTADELISARVTDVTALTNVVAALQVKPAAGPYPLFYLRGVGNFNGNGLSDSAIAFNLDGVYLGRPSSAGGVFYDLERVEALKGPQGTLYGRNATGGAINVITQTPVLGQWGGYAVGEFGDYSSTTLQGALNAPLGDNAAVRLSGQYVQHDAYLSDGSSDQDSAAARASVLLAPTDTLSVRLTGDYYKQRGDGGGSTVIGAGRAADGRTILPTTLDRQIGMGDPAVGALFPQQLVFTGGNVLAPLPDDTFLDNEFYGLSSTLQWTTNIGTLVVIPAWRESKLDFRSTVPGFLINQRETDKQHSIEARFASQDDRRVGWLIGAYYLNESIDVPLASYNQQFSATYQHFESGLETEALFGRLTWSVTDAFRINGGIRYTAEDKDISAGLYGATVLCAGTVAPGTLPPTFCFGGPRLPNTIEAPPGLVLPNGNVVPFQPFGVGSPFPGGPATTPVFLAGTQIAFDQRASFNKVTWRGGLEWDVADRSLAYASFEKGYKSGGFFITSDNPIYEPESIDAWTLGSKNRFFDNRLQLNAEAFYWTYEDQQISHVSQDSRNIVIFATENVGKSRMKGVELESQFLTSQNTLLSADVQYLDSVYEDFVFTVPSFGGAVPPIAQCPYTTVGPVYRLDCSGKRPPNAPEWTLGFAAQQTIPMGAYKLVLGARTRWQSETLASLEFQEVQYQDAFWRTDASITFSLADDRYYVTGFVNNIENDRQLGTATPHPLAPLVSSSLYDPRTYGIRVGANFK
jgi:iron complex outermembrane receptor protein